MVVSLAAADHTARRVGALEGNLSGIVPMRHGDRLILTVEETMPSRPPTVSSEDPKRLWIVDTTTGAKTALTGPWGDQPWLCRKPSPDGRYIVVSHWTAGPPRLCHLTFVDTVAATTVEVTFANSAEVVDWLQIGASWRAAVRVGVRWKSTDPPLAFSEVDPATGVGEAMADPPNVPDEFSEPKTRLPVRRC